MLCGVGNDSILMENNCYSAPMVVNLGFSEEAYRTLDFYLEELSLDAVMLVYGDVIWKRDHI